MSRTKKNKKPVGYEYWSKRPGNPSVPGKDSKKNTKRKERMDQKKMLEDIKKHH